MGTDSSNHSAKQAATLSGKSAVTPTGSQEQEYIRPSIAQALKVQLHCGRESRVPNHPVSGTQVGPLRIKRETVEFSWMCSFGLARVS